jgi:hypothetical protein
MWFTVVMNSLASPKRPKNESLSSETGKRKNKWLKVCEFEVLEKREPRLVRGAAAPELRGTMQSSEEEARG